MVNGTHYLDESSSAPFVLIERLASFWYLAIPYDVEVAKQRDVIGEAIPLFIILILAECMYGKLVMKKELYSVGDTLASLYSGITQQWVTALFRCVSLPLYLHLYSNYRVTRDLGCGSTVALWFITAFAVDFKYYWFHRWSHEYQALWSAHRVHHSGETYNLATALRQGATQPIVGFFLSSVPMAILGIPPKMFALHSSMNTISQFWFHTECINKMPFGVEYLLNTPSHHRRHHLYPGNCNYGGFLIIFDRMFGTFEAEPDRLPAEAQAASSSIASERVQPWHSYDQNYGLAEQMATFNGVEMNLIGMRKLWRISRSAKAGLWARRWDSRVGSGNNTSVVVPPLKRCRYEGYAAKVADGQGSKASLTCRHIAGFLLGFASLALQMIVKQRSVGETAVCALAGWSLIYLGGMCLDGGGKQLQQDGKQLKQQ